MVDYKSIGIALIFFLDAYLYGKDVWWQGALWAFVGLLFVWAAFASSKTKAESHVETQDPYKLEELEKRGP